jgi:MoaA/NifB/PqqE/SkfB family radical SAM enzyme
MLSSRFSPWDIPAFLAKYAYLSLSRRPILVHFEVTMRCNARCGFCDYWKTDAAEKERELKSFADAASYFNPMLITFTGGEPTLRSDLENIVATVNAAVRVKYITMLTHGAMLSAERGRSLWLAGVNQFNISLDYLDGRHDIARGIPNLTKKILATVPALRSVGVDNIRFNTVIRRDNLDQLLPIVNTANEIGCGVNFSVFTDFKNGNRDGLLQEGSIPDLESVIAELLAWKRRKRGVITNSDYYLGQIPRYVRGEMREPCRSGIRTIHIDPAGFVRRCPDFPVDFHWRDYRQYKPIDCNKCFYACRGEAQAPLRLSRLRDVMA